MLSVDGTWEICFYDHMPTGDPPDPYSQRSLGIKVTNHDTRKQWGTIIPIRSGLTLRRLCWRLAWSILRLGFRAGGE